MRRYWISEVERVLDWQEPQPAKPNGKPSNRLGVRRLNGSSSDYELLGLPARDCSRPPPTPAELKAAFRAQSLTWHPDRNRRAGQEERFAKSERNFKLIARAYEVLSDEGSRAALDGGENVDDPRWRPRPR